MTTTDRTVSDIAEVIREIDGDNKLTWAELAWGIVSSQHAPMFAHIRLANFSAFVERVNADKLLPPERLAELLVAEFDLDKES